MTRSPIIAPLSSLCGAFLLLHCGGGANSGVKPAPTPTERPVANPAANPAPPSEPAPEEV